MLTIPAPRVFWAISKKAEVSTRHLARALTPPIAQTVQRVADAVEIGGEGMDVIAAAEVALEQEFSEIKARWAFPLAIDAYKLAGTLLGNKTFIHTYGNPLVLPVAAKAIQIDAEQFGSDWLLAKQMEPALGKWIEETSRYEAAATANAMEDIVKAGIQQGAPHTAIAQTLIEHGAALTKQRATLMARTTTNWTYNEGAITQYEATGFSAFEWSATDDDSTCEFCMAMDGKTFGLRTTIVGKGDSVEGLEGGTYKSGVDVQHSPLHPHCRCTVLPAQ